MRLHVDPIEMFSRMSGCSAEGGDGLLYLTYFQLSATLLCWTSTHVSLIRSEGEATNWIMSFLWMCMESKLLACNVIRLYYRQRFAEMNRYSKDYTGIPARYRTIIRIITKYHMLAANIYVVTPLTYVTISGAARAGDPLTFPFLDVLPGRNDRALVYACKYVIYSVPAYLAHTELCFLNTTFIHYTGIMKRDVEIISGMIRVALANGDERILRNAIVRHQELLKYLPRDGVL